MKLLSAVAKVWAAIFLASLLYAQTANAQAGEVWGGEHVELHVLADAAELEFDCANGRITEALKTDANGRFSLRGTYTPQHPGPARNDIDLSVPATYAGTISKDRMELSIMAGVKAQPVGTYILVKGQSGNVRGCR